MLMREDTEDPCEIRERIEIPMGSRATLEHCGDGVTIHIPPESTSRIITILRWVVAASLVLLSFVVLANSISPLVPADWWVEPRQNRRLWEVLLLRLMGFVFGLIMLVIGINIIWWHYRSILITANPSFLIVEQSSPYRTWQQVWRRDGIGKLAARLYKNRDSESGTYSYFPRLSYCPSSPAGGQKFIDIDVGFRSKQEMEWLATTLRGVLDLPAS
jgi:hypothetical protein